MHLAVQSGNPLMVVTLLNSQPSLATRQDDKKRTPLSYAAELGHINCALLLVSTDSRACEIPDDSGNFPIYYAAVYGHVAIFALLLQQSLKLLTEQNVVGDSALSALTLRTARTSSEDFNGAPAMMAHLEAMAVRMHREAEKVARRIYFSRSLADILFFVSETYCDCTHHVKRDGSSRTNAISLV